MNRSIILTIALIIPFIAEARIVNVPADIETIQSAIDSSDAGDTVLVAPGVYNGGINFNGKAITLASNFIFSRNNADIDRTILRGGGSVVRFDSEEGQDSRLIGFWLKDGNGSDDIDDDNAGGGIHCQNASPFISNVKISDCRANYGGAIFLQFSSARIEHSVITENRAAIQGSAIYVSRQGSWPLVENCLFFDNRGTSGVGTFNFGRITLNNCTSRDATSVAIISYYNCAIWISNSVIQNQIAASIGADRYHDSLFIDYSFLSHGIESLETRSGMGIVTIGEGMLEGDPLFISERDPRPSWSLYPEEGETRSPLIDNGNPDLPEDPDGTRADIGYYPFNQGGSVSGVVYYHDQIPIENASIFHNDTLIATSDQIGRFFIRNIPAVSHDFDVRATQFNDRRYIDLDVRQRDTLRTEFELLQPRLEILPERRDLIVRTGTTESIPIQILNPGNGNLEFTSTMQLTGEGHYSPGEIHRRLVTDNLGTPYGSAFVDDTTFLIIRDFNRDYSLFAFDQDLNFVDNIPLPTPEDRVTQLTTDGEDLWLLSNNPDSLYRFSRTDRQIIASFALPDETWRCLTWDSDHSRVLVGSNEGLLLEIDPANGAVVASHEVPDFSFRSIAYLPESYYETGFYALEYNDTSFYKLNLETGEATPVFSIIGIPTLIAGGNIIPNYDKFGNAVVLVSSRGLEGLDALNWHQLNREVFWSSRSPVSASVEPVSELQVDLTIDATTLALGDYQAEIIFDHNGAGLQETLPLTLRVTDLSTGSEGLLPPATPSLSTFPNPFNSTVTISYSEGQVSKPVSLAIYDLSGRLVADLSSRTGDLNRRSPSGEQRLVWEAGDVPAGVYLIRLESGSEIRTIKTLLMK